LWVGGGGWGGGLGGVGGFCGVGYFFPGKEMHKKGNPNLAVLEVIFQKCSEVGNGGVSQMGGRKRASKDAGKKKRL